MTDITTKEELAHVTRQARRRLEDALSGLSDTDLQVPGVTGVWSIKDILAHIAYWEGEFLRWYHAGQRGDVLERPDPDNIDPYNHMIYERYASTPLAEVRALFAQSHRALTAALDAMTPAELFTPEYYAWTGAEYPLAVYLRSNADEHYDEHAATIEAWRAGR